MSVWNVLEETDEEVGVVDVKTGGEWGGGRRGRGTDYGSVASVERRGWYR